MMAIRTRKPKTSSGTSKDRAKRIAAERRAAKVENDGKGAREMRRMLSGKTLAK